MTQTLRFERIDYEYANRWTFKIPSIKRFIKQEINDGTWIDPYAGLYSPATITNDLNPNMPTNYHLDALEFVNKFDRNSVDGVIYDPPYSNRQISDCYKSLGLTVTEETTQSSFYLRVQKRIRLIIKPGGKVICCGWNSNGLNDRKNFRLDRILLVPHGSHRNDTIVTVFSKINSTLD